MISDSSSYIIGNAQDELGNPIDLFITHAILSPPPKISNFSVREYPIPRLKSRTSHGIVIRDAHYV